MELTKLQLQAIRSLRNIADEIKIRILEDEFEYCFDESYCSNDRWEQEHGDKTRLQAYTETVAWVNSLKYLSDLFFHYGDKYDFVIEYMLEKEAG